MKKRVFLTAALLAGAAQAFNVGAPQTFSKLTWSAGWTAPAFIGCGLLVFDATGDLINSDTLVLAGALNCPGGAYGMSGSLYLANDSSLNITMVIGGHTVSCPRVFGWVGTCNVYDAAGFLRGSGPLALR
jgi:hypothetical protein